jgi:hypothetical protein
VREVFIADTDAEAMRLSLGGMMGRMMKEYFLPLLASFGFTEFLKHKADVPDSDVTPEYCARHNWLVGSPATVTERLHAIYDEVGGFGTILLFCFDYTENPQAWRHSMELLAARLCRASRTWCPNSPHEDPVRRRRPDSAARGRPRRSAGGHRGRSAACPAHPARGIGATGVSGIRSSPTSSRSSPRISGAHDALSSRISSWIPHRSISSSP